MSVIYRSQKSRIIEGANGDPVAWTAWRDVLLAMNDELLRLRADLIAAGVLTSSGGSGSSLAGDDVDLYTFRANGPYTVDADVDGSIDVKRPGTITAVWLTRTTPGTSGSTILDLNRNGTSLYTTQANRPTILFSDADEQVACTLPDVVGLSIGDALTADTDAVEDGTPEGWALQVVVEPS